MTQEIRIPDVESLKKMEDGAFAGVVCTALRRYQMQTPAFNLAARARTARPFVSGHAMLIYPDAVQGLILTSLKALHEYDETGRISPNLREEFIVAETKDLLRTMDADKTSPEYQAHCDSVMQYVSSRLTGIGSLVLTPPPEGKKSRFPKPPDFLKPR